MALRTKQLIEQNKKAYRHYFYIESMHLSYSLITRALRQIISDETKVDGLHKAKLSDCIKALRKEYERNPLFKKILKKDLYKNLCEFSNECKTISRELKFQYPALKLKNASRRGLGIVASLQAVLIKLKSNRS